MTTATVTEINQTEAIERDHLVTLPAGDLYNAVANAMLFASKDDSLPVLNAVLLRYDKATKALTVTATDRYRMIFTLAGDSETMSTDAESFDALISLARAKDMAARLKNFKKFDDPQMQIEFMDSKLEMIYYERGNELIEQIPLIEDANYPAITSLIKDAFKEAAYTPKTDLDRAAATVPNQRIGAYASFNPAYLGDVAKVKDLRLTPSQRRNDTVDIALSTNQRKPSLFRHGNWAYGLVMPVFIKDRRDGLEHLSDMTEAPAWIS